MWLYVLILRYIMVKSNPRVIPVDTSLSVWSPLILLCLHQFLYLWSLAVAIVFCLFHDWFLFSRSFTLLPLCLCPRVHGGHQTMAAIQPLHTSCADWHHRDGSAHDVPCCCCCRVHLWGRDNRLLKHSTKWISRPQPYLFICLWLPVLNLQQCVQDNKEDDLIKTTAEAAEF